jgi:hypothetical protein
MFQDIIIMKESPAWYVIFLKNRTVRNRKGADPYCGVQADEGQKPKAAKWHPPLGEV